MSLREAIFRGFGRLTCTIESPAMPSTVLKSTGSAFEGFYRDEYTTLAEVPDRIFSTAVDATWEFDEASVAGPDDLATLGEKAQFNKVAAYAREVTLEIFATDESASVQVSVVLLYGGLCGCVCAGGRVCRRVVSGSTPAEAPSSDSVNITLPCQLVFADCPTSSFHLDRLQATLFKTASKLVEGSPAVHRATYALPNKHFVPVPMDYLGIENVTPACVFLYTRASSEVTDFARGWAGCVCGQFIGGGVCAAYRAEVRLCCCCFGR